MERFLEGLHYGGDVVAKRVTPAEAQMELNRRTGCLESINAARQEGLELFAPVLFDHCELWQNVRK